MLKSFTTIMLLIVFSMLHLPLNGMNKKQQHNSMGVRTMLDTFIKDQIKYKNLTTKVQIVVEDKQIEDKQLKNSDALRAAWQSVLEKTPIYVDLHRFDSAVLVQVEVTEATKTLKKFFKSSIISKTFRQIKSGKMTSPFKPIVTQPQPGNSFLYTTMCGLTLFSAGWLSKTIWDAGGFHYSFTTCSHLIKLLIDELNL